MSRVGFTTTIPVEVLLAAGHKPVDLNNVFITSPQAQAMVDQAEEAGYPRNTCGWIKGLYSVALREQLDAVIAVMQGDCSNTQALMETLQLQQLNIIPFAYPYDRDRQLLQLSLAKLQQTFNIERSQIDAVWHDLKQIRRLCLEIDRLTWEENVVTGAENHYYQVTASDFNGDPVSYKQELEDFIQAVKNRPTLKNKVRLAFIGVPPIFTDLYTSLEDMGARVVFNEVQRQFTMPYEAEDIIDQYLTYTYPYGAFARLADIEQECQRRQIDGIIHYTQTFCFRQIEDLIFRDKLKLPFITLEGDKPGRLDARSRMRLEAFINMF